MKLEPPRPCGWIPDIGSGLCAPIYGEGIIPPRHPVPGRLKGEPIRIVYRLYGPDGQKVEE